MFPAGPEEQAQDESDPHRTSTASSGTQCSPPDPNSKLRIRVVPAGPPPQPLDQSVPRPTSTASSGYLRIIVFPARPQQQPLDQSVPRRTSTASSGSECSLPFSPPYVNRELRIKVFLPEFNHKESPKIYQIKRMSEYMPESMSDRMAEKKHAVYTSRWYVRNYVRIVFQGGGLSKKMFFQNQEKDGEHGHLNGLQTQMRSKRQNPRQVLRSPGCRGSSSLAKSCCYYLANHLYSLSGKHALQLGKGHLEIFKDVLRLMA